MLKKISHQVALFAHPLMCPVTFLEDLARQGTWNITP